MCYTPYWFSLRSDFPSHPLHISRIPPPTHPHPFTTTLFYKKRIGFPIVLEQGFVFKQLNGAREEGKGGAREHTLDYRIQRQPYCFLHDLL